MGVNILPQTTQDGSLVPCNPPTPSPAPQGADLACRPLLRVRIHPPHHQEAPLALLIARYPPPPAACKIPSPLGAVVSFSLLQAWVFCMEHVQPKISVLIKPTTPLPSYWTPTTGHMTDRCPFAQCIKKPAYLWPCFPQNLNVMSCLMSHFTDLAPARAVRLICVRVDSHQTDVVKPALKDAGEDEVM